MSNLRIRKVLRVFAFDTRGAALVEFAIVLPVMLLFFALIVESGRTFWHYQAAISGVRDAARYVARAAPHDICEGGLAAAEDRIETYTSAVTLIVVQNMRKGADPIFPPRVTADPIMPSVACTAGDYRNDPAPVATVSANVTIGLPFADIFTLFGGTITEITTVVSDSSKVYGT